jgi:hypothetical protein
MDGVEEGAVEREGSRTCLSRCVETEHEQAHFFRSEDLAHHFGDLAAHCRGGG